MSEPKFCRVCGANMTADEPVERDGLSVDPAGPVIWHGAPVRLTRAELIVLHSLVTEATRPVTRGALMERIGSDVDTNVIEMLVTRIKKKLRTVGPEPLLTSVWGSGAYTWGVEK